MMDSYVVTAKLWRYPGKAAWYFLTLPSKEAQEIKDRYSIVKKGFGSLPITATIGETSWATSIFPDRKIGSYLLPVKAEVRQRENINQDDRVTVSVEVRA